MPETMTIIPTECEVVHEGVNANGNDYKLHRLKATTANGQPINRKMTTFDNFPLGEPVEVDISVYKEDERYGTTFTVKKAGGRSGGQTSGGGAASGELDRRLKEVETRLRAVEQKVGAEIPF